MNRYNNNNSNKLKQEQHLAEGTNWRVGNFRNKIFKKQ